MPIVADTNRFAALQSDDDDSFLEGKHVSTASKWVGGIRAPLIPLKIVRLKVIALKGILQIIYFAILRI